MTKRDDQGKTPDENNADQARERELTERELGGVAGGVKKTPIPMPQGDDAGTLKGVYSGTVKR